MALIEAVILDVDGTVATCPYDFEGMRAVVRRLAAAHGVDTTALGIRGIIEQIGAVASRLPDGAARFREEAEAAVIEMEIESARTAELLPGAAEALSRLRRDGLAIALITRNCRAASQLVLDGFDDYDVLLTRDDVPHLKPHPDHIHRALAAIGRGPNCAAVGRGPNCAAVVGDHIFDMQAGVAAGVRLCVGVRTGSSSEAELLKAGADEVIDTLADLPEVLRRHEERPQ